MKFKFGFKSYTSSDSFTVRSSEQSTPESIKQAIEKQEKK